MKEQFKLFKIPMTNVSPPPPMQKIALITGITGQDGAYLAQLLLKKKYLVVGLIRYSDNTNFDNLEYLNILNEITFQYCDLLNMSNIMEVINRYMPNEIYNLAAQSSVGLSFSLSVETLSFNILSTINILESIKAINKEIKFYQASSSEMFGSSNTLPLTETSIFHPVSPYGISKASAHWITVNYRESFNMFTTSGILFNHESPLRKDNFIIKKIIKTSLDIQEGKVNKLEVGNIDIKRDFGYAPMYVEAMFLMMQHDKPDDYIIASGKSLSIRDIIYYVFSKLNINYNKIEIKKCFFRPNEIQNIYGSPVKANKILNWNYKLNFYEVLDLLIEEEKHVYNNLR